MTTFEPGSSLKYWPGKPLFCEPISIDFIRKIDDVLFSSIIDYIRNSFSNLSLLGLNHVIVGYSGGIDSACTLLLCKEALGASNVSAVIVNLDSEVYAEQNAISIQTLDSIGISFQLIDAVNLYKMQNSLISAQGSFSDINVITRCIQNAIFQVADTIPAAVASTIDKSEEYLGRYTEYFYGHLAPLLNLYKSEVIELASYLGIPEQIIDKEPGCNAWLDSTVLGVDYSIIDSLLHLLVKKQWTCNEILSKYHIDPAWLTKFEERTLTQQFRIKTSTPCY